VNNVTNVFIRANPLKEGNIPDDQCLPCANLKEVKGHTPTPRLAKGSHGVSPDVLTNEFLFFIISRAPCDIRGFYCPET
jgi:hypothetical protein